MGTSSVVTRVMPVAPTRYMRRSQTSGISDYMTIERPIVLAT